MDEKESAFIEAANLTLKTPLGRVYENASFTVKKGQVCALFGTEGSGKTSLLLTLSGRMKYSSGTATVGGYDLKKQYNKIRDISGISVIERINDVPEYLAVKDILAADLRLAGKPGNKRAVDDYLAQWKFSDFANTSFRQLSARNRNYFEVMLACSGDPALLLVDDIQEGMTQHDSIRMVQMFQHLAKDRGMTVLFCTNEYEIARYSDCVVVTSQEAESQRAAVVAATGRRTNIYVAGWANGTTEAIEPAADSASHNDALHDLLTNDPDTGEVCA